MELLSHRVHELIENDLVDSAITLCTFALSSKDAITPADNNTVVLELLGDCLLAKKEYKRALNIYRQAVRAHFGSAGASRSKMSTVKTEADVRVLLKEAQCRVCLQDHLTALTDIEAIPAHLRTVKINKKLGELYSSTGLKRHAITAYKEVLRDQPSAVEALLALTELGIDKNELDTLLLNVSAQDREVYDNLCVNWLPGLARANVHKKNTHYAACNTEMVQLFNAYPKNPLVLAQMGQVAFESEKLDYAISLIKQARRMDPLFFSPCCTLALALYLRHDAAELSRLANECLESDASSSAGWIAAGLFADMKDDAEKAFRFFNKAVKLSNGDAKVLRVQAHMLTKHGKPEQAIVAYTQSNSLDRDFATYTGLVEAHLQMHKSNEAMAIVKEYLTTQPKSATAHFLLGRVLMGSNYSNGSNGRSQAKKSYLRALKLNPSKDIACLALTELLCADGEHKEALIHLQATVARSPTAELRKRYGAVLAELGRFEEAVQQLQLAISISHDPSDAMQELDRVESLMRGSPMSGHDDEADGSLRSTRSPADLGYGNRY